MSQIPAAEFCAVGPTPDQPQPASFASEVPQYFTSIWRSGSIHFTWRGKRLHQLLRGLPELGHKGYDAGKVSGIKRHIAVDTQLPHAIHVTTTGFGAV